MFSSRTPHLRPTSCWNPSESWIGQWHGRGWKCRMLYHVHHRCALMIRLTEIATHRGSFQTTRALRVFLSHTVSGQVWQSGGEPSSTNFETGEGIPGGWQLHIEGRLLELCPRSQDTGYARRGTSSVRPCDRLTFRRAASR
ncbi:hypothetical protein DFP72DRAFT_114522 [Ephemerocybe angulata]|uniref:Uncharacterized protein n=1 Tax=Ephemerocybe angulata TaxID=980116 RepID=A0A8H6HAV1_9AGAR|nr:hypothetical protein DFP72DRAFT_114522 [Tulosesus angulatus]